MFDILRFVVQIIESIIFIYISYQLLDRKLNFYYAIVMGIILSFFWSFCYVIGIGVIKNLLVYRMLTVFMICIASRANILKVLISVFVSLNVCLMIEYTVIALVTIILSIPIQSIEDNTLIYIIVYMISFIFGCVFYLILKKYNLSLFDRHQNYFSVERTFYQSNNMLTRIKEMFNEYNFLIIIIVIQMTIVTYYFYSIEYFQVFTKAERVISVELKTIFLCLTLLFLNIMTLFLVKKVQKVREEIYHSKIKEIEFSHIEKESQIIRQYKHDLHNHFSLLCSLAEKKKYNEVYRYLVNYHVDIKSKIIPINTGLEELNTLLYLKINIAQQNNIKVDYKCYTNIQCDKGHIIDFISIIGNLLDNAIEASQKSEKRLIKICIDEEILDYIFTIENTFEDKEILTSDTLLQEGFSTKGHGRGFGLKIVNKLVKKYDGSIEFKNDEDFFRIKVILSKHELEKY